MSNASREDSGLQMFLCGGLQMSLHKTITSNRVGIFRESKKSKKDLHNQNWRTSVLQRTNCLVVYLWDRNQDFINFSISILLKTKYFKAAYGTFTLNWIRKKEKHSTSNLAELWWDLTATVSLSAKLSFSLGVTWWQWWCNVLFCFIARWGQVELTHAQPVGTSYFVKHSVASDGASARLLEVTFAVPPQAEQTGCCCCYPSLPPDSCQQLPYLFLHPVTLPQTGTTLKNKRVISL